MNDVLEAGGAVGCELAPAELDTSHTSHTVKSVEIAGFERQRKTCGTYDIVTWLLKSGQAKRA